MMFNCEYCLITYDTEQDDYKFEIVSQFLQDSTQVFLCENCLRGFKSLREFLHHSFTCTQDKYSSASVFCKQCSTEFKSLQEFKQHNNTCAQGKCINVAIYCKQCLTVFKSLREFKEHWYAYEQGKCINVALPSLLSTSSDFYEQKSESEQTSSNFIQVNSITGSEENSFLCDHRSMEFKSLEEFMEHCRTCTNIHF